MTSPNGLTSFAVTRGDEVYVYVRGQLVLKRRLLSDGEARSALFQLIPRFTYWLKEKVK